MMKRFFDLFLGLVLPLGLMLVPAMPAGAQAAGITLLDRSGRPTTALVDGNQVSLQVQLGQMATAQTPVEFLLSGLDRPVAACTIPLGAASCQSDSFPALGWYWGADGSALSRREIRAYMNGAQIEAGLSVSVAPRPVIMVHGYNSNFEVWRYYLGPQGYLASIGVRGFAVGDGQVPGVMNTGSLISPRARTNTIAENATILGEYIDRVQAETGAEKVDLLVHSMGGMISRYYLDRVMKDADVAQVMFLGTPMAGSDCAALPAALGVLLPASLEIQPGYMVGIFNQQIFRRRGIAFHAIAGTKLLNAVESPCTPVPSDLVVTLDSVKAIPMPVQEIPLLHTELNSSSEVFARFVKPLLETPPGGFTATEDPLPGSVALAPVQFTRTYTGHLDPGEARDIIINIDPNVTVAGFALYDTTRTLDVTVVGASGNAVQLDPVQNGLIRVSDPSTLIYLGYGFRDPRPGRWVVTLHTTAATPAGGADYAIAARFNGGATLQARLNTLLPQLHEAVTITADLTAAGIPVALDGAQVQLRRPNGSLETLPMEVAGHTATLTVRPVESSLHGLEVSVRAHAANGMEIDRAVFLTFEAQPSGQRISRNQFLVLLGLALVVGLIVWMIRTRR